MPIDYNKYPPNWKTEIRPRILERDQHRCKFCALKNYQEGYRDKNGAFWPLSAWEFLNSDTIRRIKIVLTIAHLDHDEDNHDVQDDRLAALCQQCHLRYDAKEKSRRRNEKKKLKMGQIELEL